MPEQNAKPVQGSGGEWVLNFGQVRVHNSHLQSGSAHRVGCGLCEKGLAGIMEVAEGERSRASEAEVVEGDGADKAKDSASSPGDGSDRGTDPLPW